MWLPLLESDELINYAEISRVEGTFVSVVRTPLKVSLQMMRLLELR